MMKLFNRKSLVAVAAGFAVVFSIPAVYALMNKNAGNDNINPGTTVSDTEAEYVTDSDTIINDENAEEKSEVHENQLFAAEPEYKYIDFDVQYTQTSYSSNAEYPQELWITDENELAEYCRTNINAYDNSAYDENYNNMVFVKNSFSEAVKKYDKSFFENNDLLIVVLMEGSGSIQHEVTGVKLLKNLTGQERYYVQPEICEYCPYIFTEDMAEWHILIEIKKEYGKSVSEPLDPVFFKGFGKSIEEAEDSGKIWCILSACTDYLGDSVKECVEYYVVDITNEVPVSDNYISLSETNGEGPYNIVEIGTLKDEVSEHFVLLVNQNMEVIGEFKRF